MQLRLPVHSYKHRSTPASSARLLNCYAEQLPADAKTPVALIRAPGQKAFANIGSGPIRGLHFALGYMWPVSGNTLWRVDQAGSATSMGTVTTGSIDMDHNDQFVVVVSEPNGFYCDAAGTFGQITDTDFTSRGAGDVEFLQNFLLFREPDSGVFFGADLGSVGSFDALSFATAETNPDRLVGMKVDHSQVVLAGEESIEIWDNTPISGFPFERAVNGYVELGCFAGRTLQKLDNSLIWVANDYTVRRLQGTTPVRISTHAVEQFLSTTTVSSGTAFTYTQDGHLWYVLNFLEGSKAYDATTNEWADRQSYGYDNWRWQTSCTAWGRQFVGDSMSNSICELDPFTYAEAPSDPNFSINTQRMEWAYQPVYAEGQRAFHDRLEVVLETGVGLTTGQGSDPVMMMDYSDDGGLTWKSLPNKKIGAIGQYRKRVVWSGLGSSAMRVYRGSISDPIKVTITDTLLTVRGGRLTGGGQ